MKLRILAALALPLTAAACTPEQLAYLGISPDEPVYDFLLSWPDVAVPLGDGTILNLDGTVTPMVAVGEPPVP